MDHGPPNEGSVPSAQDAQSQAMQQELDQISAQIADLKIAQQRSRTLTTVFTIAVVVMMLIFSLVTYRVVRTNFEPDSLRSQLQVAMVEMWPGVTEKLADVATIVAPVYREQLTTKLKDISPEVVRLLAKELDGVPDTIRTEIDTAIKASLQRVSLEIRPELESLFPGLDSREKMDELLELLQAKLAEKAEGVADHLQNLFVSDSDRVAAVMEGFAEPLNLPETITPEQQLLHLLLLYADYELMRETPAEDIEDPSGEAPTPEQAATH